MVSPLATEMVKTSSAVPPPTSILSLPAELYIAIALNLDLSSALSFARVSRAFCAAATYRIWRNVDCQVMRTLGPADNAAGAGMLTDGVDAEFGTVSRRQAVWAKEQAAVEVKVGTILGQAEGCKGSMIRALKLVSGVAMEGQREILRIAAANLGSLTIAGSSRGDSGPTVPLLESFDHHLVSHLSFPSLTHIFLSFGSFHSSALVIALCNAAPGVTHLGVCIGADDSDPKPTAILLQPTKLRELQLFAANERISPPATSRISELIARSSELRKLAVSYVPSGSLSSGELYTVVFAAKAETGSLQCAVDAEAHGGEEVQGNQDEGGDVESSEGVRRVLYMALQRFKLVSLRLSRADGQFDLIPRLPHLDTIRLRRVDLSALTNQTASLLNLDLQNDNEDIFTRLDRLDRSSCRPIGQIRSIRHESQELILASLLLPPTDETLTPPTPPIPSPNIIEIHQYPALTETPRPTAVEREVRKSWREFSDLDGIAVPMSVVKRMLATEGVQEGEWTGRGLEVGDGAWEVLRRWQETGSEGEDEEVQDEEDHAI